MPEVLETPFENLPPVEEIVLLNSLGRREEVLTTREVMRLFPRELFPNVMSPLTLRRWIQAGVILEPAKNLDTRQRMWTRVEINALYKYAFAKGCLRVPAAVA